MQSFELMNWCCRENAYFNIAAQCVDNLSLHVIHVGFISDLFDSERLVVHVKRSETSYCHWTMLVSNLTVMKMHCFIAHLSS